MEIQNVNYPILTPIHGNFRGGFYNPQGVKPVFNPASKYINDFMGRTLSLSRRMIKAPEPEIAPFTRVVQFKDKNGKGTYGWDINDGNRDEYVVIMHGLSQNISTIQHLYRKIIKETNYAILAPEYRSFGKNPPEKIKPSILFNDNMKALEYLKEDRGISPNKIRVIGYSFGGSPATRLAVKNPDLEGLILVSAADAMRHGSVNIDSSFKKKLPNFIKFLYDNLAYIREPLAGFLEAEKYLKKLKLPLDIIHSEDDKTVLVSASSNLAGVAGSNTRSCTILPDGGHSLDSKKADAIVSLLNNTVKPSGR